MKLNDFVGRIYEHRFRGAQDRKHAVWAVICKQALQPWIPKTARVLDLGGGYGEFVRHIEAGRKYVVDINPATTEIVRSHAEVLLGALDSFEARLAGNVDVIFCSNFLEHLPTKDVLLETVECCRRILAPGGRLIVLGPNIRFLAGEYWDFLDHHLPLSDRTVDELLAVTGFCVIHRRAAFLPYTFRQRLPAFPWLVSLYLGLPPAQWLLGKQYFFVAEKTA
ncbi:MAG: class I SAM-dependent methyltransferase [Verrucomicrobiia bacterium]